MIAFYGTEGKDWNTLETKLGNNWTGLIQWIRFCLKKAKIGLETTDDQTVGLS